MTGFRRLRSVDVGLALLLLLLQGWFGPAFALRAATTDETGTVICHGGGGPPEPDHPVVPGDHCPACPMCQALAGGVVTAAPPLVPVPDLRGRRVPDRPLAQDAEVAPWPRPHPPTGPPA